MIYDQQLTDQSIRQLRQALINSGYNDARVETELSMTSEKKIGINYKLYPGEPHVIGTVSYEFQDPEIEELVISDTIAWPAQPGEKLDRNLLDRQRAMIVEKLRDNGYFAFTKEHIGFIADTVAGEKKVELTMVVHNPRIQQQEAAEGSGKEALGELLVPLPRHNRYMYRKVVIVPDFSPGDNSSDFNFAGRDTVYYDGLEILYGPDPYLSPKALAEQCFIRPGELYSTTGIDRTYEALNRLAILRYVNILTRPAGTDGQEQLLDAYILLSRTKKMGVTLELEGTNSEGDLGVGGGITFQHRNLAKGGEQLTAKFRGAYESLSGNLDGLINDSYTELAGELGITFPTFKAPFLRRSFKQKMRASTEFAVTFMRQERPEYTRVIAGGTWRYKWADRSNLTRRTFDLIDINVVNLPRTIDFIDKIAPDNPLLRYSYEDHFIMRMGYTWYHTNRQAASADIGRTSMQTNTYTTRASVETAGALLYAISSMINQRRSDGAYSTPNI